MSNMCEISDNISLPDCMIYICLLDWKWKLRCSYYLKIYKKISDNISPLRFHFISLYLGDDVAMLPKLCV